MDEAILLPEIRHSFQTKTGMQIRTIQVSDQLAKKRKLVPCENMQHVAIFTKQLHRYFNYLETVNNYANATTVYLLIVSK